MKRICPEQGRVSDTVLLGGKIIGVCFTKKYYFSLSTSCHV